MKPMRLFVLPVFLLAACGGGGPECEPSEKIDAWEDRDGDGFGDSASPKRVCSIDKSVAPRDGDCDDSIATVNPFAPEVCNGLDDDCDGRIDERFVTLPWYPDGDGDGFGDAVGSPTWACAAPEGHVARAGDCDDGAEAVNPEAPEVCNGIDDDCDGLLDDLDDNILPSELTLWYRDADGDGYGDPNATTNNCDQPANTVTNADDCADNNPLVNPLGLEVCNGGDDNCDGLVDDADPTVDPATFREWYFDADLDGFGDPATTALACALPLGYRANAEDCDDADPAVGAAPDWFLDGDGDGVGAPPVAASTCLPPDAYHVDASLGADCDDLDPTVFPGAPEVCNGVDDNCNGLADDADPGVDLATATDFYVDMDQDGFGDPANVITRCNQPPFASASDQDCDDADPAVNPDADEQCNGIDDDCDGLTDDDDTWVDPLTLTLWYFDGDGDGWGDLLQAVATCDPPPGHVADPTDCDDADPAVGGAEIWYVDADGDGFGDTASIAGPSCTEPAPGYVRFGAGLDCDDTRDTSWPGAPEICADGLDQDCNGIDDCALLDEDWESGLVEPLVWSAPLADAGLVSSPALGAWSMRIGSGGEVESQPLDTSGCQSLEWRWSGKRGPVAPVVSEFLVFEYFDGLAWVPAFNWQGNGFEDPAFQSAIIPMSDPSALHPTFALRMRNAILGPATAEFYLDDLRLICL